MCEICRFKNVGALRNVKMRKLNEQSDKGKYCGAFRTPQSGAEHGADYKQLRTALGARAGGLPGNLGGTIISCSEKL